MTEAEQKRVDLSLKTIKQLLEVALGPCEITEYKHEVTMLVSPLYHVHILGMVNTTPEKPFLTMIGVWHEPPELAEEMQTFRVGFVDYFAEWIKEKEEWRISSGAGPVYLGTSATNRRVES